MSGVGAYVRRKDRHHQPYGLHRNPEPPLGQFRHAVLPSGMVITWRDEFPLPQTALPPLRFEPIPVEP